MDEGAAAAHVRSTGRMSLRARLLLLAGFAALPAVGLVGHLDGWEPARLGVIAIAVLAIAWVGSELLVLRGLRRALGAVRQVAAGSPGSREPLARGPAELRPLARIADEVAQAVQSRQAALEQAEARRRAAEARVASVLDIDTDAVVGVNDAEQITFFNRGAERVFGHLGRKAVGQPLDLILPPGENGARRASLRELAGASGRREVVGRRQDGGQFPAEIGVSARTEEGRTAFMLVLRDLTEVKRAEAARRESEARFRSTFDHSGVGMAFLGTDGSFVRVNQALCEMLGYSESALLEMTERTLIPPDDPEPDPWYERSLGLGSIRWYQREQRYVHKLGHVVWGLLSVSLVRAGDGHPLCRLVQVQDITERKRAEQLEAQLRQAQKLDAIGQLAAGVAHDFNNLLMVITGRSHILLHHLGDDDPLRRHVELIQTTSLRAGALTQQLLAFSRKQVLQPQVLDLDAVVAGMMPMLRRLIGEEITLTATHPETLGHVKADPGQLEQVVLNLVVNARDAMPRGGRLTLKTADVDLDEGFVAAHAGAHPGSYVSLAVHDTGVGMDAATRGRVFEPFFTTKGLGKGTGLGLATVYGIVKQSGGYVEVESEAGKGSTFTVYLPRVADPLGATEPARPLGELPRGRETILLVEDEEAVRDLAGEILEQAGYTVLGARHGGEALLLGDRYGGPIHLLVTDVVMPEMGGPQLAERLAETRPGMRVVYMSGYTDEAIEHHGVLSSGALFLRKPLTPEDLRRKVREVLDAPQEGESAAARWLDPIPGP